MKNFKKVLALVLAIATLLSFATVASAKTADFADAKDVKNTEAVDVLSYIKVLEGYPADNTFKPAKNITREEAAKIIAIFANKSTDISSLYTSANPFADMKGRWGESYVAYGYRAGIIAGKNATSFVPKANVKGTEFLKMVLVVLGYDQNKEGLVGSSWAVNTLELAKLKGLLAGLGSDFDPNAALTRDQAAQIMLNALKAEKVVYGQTITNLVWNAKLGYWTVGNTTTAAAAVYVSPNGAQNNYNHELLAKDFNLTLTPSQDKWGRPTHTWAKGATAIGEYVDSDKLLKTYYTAVTECDVAKDAGFKTAKTLKLFVNGNEFTDVIRPTATANKLGAQGRLTEVYDDRIVMIDTFLAKVTKVTDATYDKAGHQIDPAKIELAVYDETTHSNATAGAALTLESTVNFTYAKGDYLLINAYTSKERTEIGQANVDVPDRVYTSRVTEGDKAYAEIVGKAESIEGSQSVIWYNNSKHVIDGTTIDDASTFYLDEAEYSLAKHTWFKDQYGNLIGDVKVATVYNYGVITKLWNNNDNSVGSGKTMATIKYMDNTEATVEVSSFTLATGNTYAPAYGMYGVDVMKFNGAAAGVTGTVRVSGNIENNAAYDAVKINAQTVDNFNGFKYDVIDGHLFQIETKADGSVALTLVQILSKGTQLADATNTKVNVINKAGWISQTVTTGGTETTTNKVAVNDNTKFLYTTPVDKNGDFDEKGTYEYKLAEGASNVPTFASVYALDAIDTDSDGVANYVYIIGVTVDATKAEFIYNDVVSYNGTINTAGNNIQYYEITVPSLDGANATTTLKVKFADKAKVIDKLVNNVGDGVGRLFYVTYTGDYATDLHEIDTTPYQYDAKNKADMRAILVAGATYDGNFLQAYDTTTNPATATARYNVATAKTIVGELTADMMNKNIYVIYDVNNGNVESLYVSSRPVTPKDPFAKTEIKAIKFYTVTSPVKYDAAPVFQVVVVDKNDKVVTDALASSSCVWYNTTDNSTVTYFGAAGVYGVRANFTLNPNYKITSSTEVAAFFGATPTNGQFGAAASPIVLKSGLNGYLGTYTVG